VTCIQVASFVKLLTDTLVTSRLIASFFKEHFDNKHQTFKENFGNKLTHCKLSRNTLVTSRHIVSF